jgi:hypothetical protein
MYVCLYACMHEYAQTAMDGYPCISYQCISTHTDRIYRNALYVWPRQSAAQSAVRTAPRTYLPTRRNGRTGADLSALRARPAPIAAAALDRRHQCALRDFLACPSLQRTADERARRRSVVIRSQPSVGVLTVELYVLATGYYEYSHLQYAAVRSCHSTPRPSASAAAVPGHLQWGTFEYSRWYSTYWQGLTRVL